MPRLFTSTVCAASLLLLLSCSNQDRERADARTEEARKEAHKLGAEARQEATQLNASVNKALQNGKPGESAERKLDRAAMIAKIKANLATSVGLTAAATVGVDSQGSVVTLTGSLPTQDARLMAEKSASQVDGVTQVIDHIAVKAN